MVAQRLAVFDMDGTLLDSLPDLAECCRSLLARYALPLLSDSDVRGMVGLGVQVLVHRALTEARRRYEVQEVRPAPVLVTEAEAATEFMALYAPRATRLSRLFPDTEKTLQTLRAQGWRLAICTNKPVAAANSIVEAFGLSGLFAAICGGDSFEGRKPDPRHLTGTIDQAGGQIARSVMIGDMAPDWQAAEASGCRFLYAGWGYGQQGPAGGGAVADAMANVPASLNMLLPAA